MVIDTVLMVIDTVLLGVANHVTVGLENCGRVLSIALEAWLRARWGQLMPARKGNL